MNSASTALFPPPPASHHRQTTPFDVHGHFKALDLADTLSDREKVKVTLHQGEVSVAPSRGRSKSIDDSCQTYLIEEWRQVDLGESGSVLELKLNSPPGELDSTSSSSRSSASEEFYERR